MSKLGDKLAREIVGQLEADGMSLTLKDELPKLSEVKVFAETDDPDDRTKRIKYFFGNGVVRNELGVPHVKLDRPVRDPKAVMSVMVDGDAAGKLGLWDGVLKTMGVGKSKLASRLTKRITKIK